MIVVLELRLNVATIISDCISSILLSDFTDRGSISIPTPPMAEFFHADTETNVHPLPVSWYFISSQYWYLCSCMHTMYTLWYIADAVSSGSGPILFKVLTLNVGICIVILHFLFVWVLQLIFRTLRPELQPQQNAPLFYSREGRWGLDVWFE